MAEAFIYDHVRTPRGRGKKDGALHEVSTVKLAAQVLDAIRDRNELDAGAGRRRHPRLRRSGRRGRRRHRPRARSSPPAIRTRVPGIQVNRYCASGLDAVNLAAAAVASGQHDLVIAGGVESMSRVGIGASGNAWPMDPIVALPGYFMPQGVSADLIATKYGFSRDRRRRLCGGEPEARRQRLGRKAISPSRSCRCSDVNGLRILDRDEHMRPDTDMQKLGGAQPVLHALRRDGRVRRRRHPGASRCRGGRACPSRRQFVRHRRRRRRGAGRLEEARRQSAGLEAARQDPRLRQYRLRAGDDADRPGRRDREALQTRPACRSPTSTSSRSTRRSPPWCCATSRPSTSIRTNVNVNGGAIAMGHPLGATGAMILGTVLDELERRDLDTALVTLCIGAGMGTATIIERV